MSSPVDAVVFAATSFEAKSISSRLKRRKQKASAENAKPFIHWTGALGEWKSCVVVQCGLGDDRSRSAAKWAFDSFSPARAFIIGVSGGLDPDLSVGSLVLATESCSVQKSRRDPIQSLCDPGTRLDKFVKSHREKLIRGAILSSDEIVTSIEEKGILHAATKAVAVDMESYGICATAHELGIPICVLRTIIDDAKTNLPEAMMDLVSPEGESESIGKVLTKALGSFSLIKGLLGMPSRYMKAQNALSVIASAIISLSVEKS